MPDTILQLLDKKKKSIKMGIDYNGLKEFLYTK
jgi:hypothetical protein